MGPSGLHSVWGCCFIWSKAGVIGESLVKAGRSSARTSCHRLVASRLNCSLVSRIIPVSKAGPVVNAHAQSKRAITYCAGHKQ